MSHHKKKGKEQFVREFYLDCVKASTAVAAATEDINTNIDIMCSTELTWQLLRPLQAGYFPEVIQEYAITDVEEQSVNQTSQCMHNRPTDIAR